MSNKIKYVIHKLYRFRPKIVFKIFKIWHVFMCNNAMHVKAFILGEMALPNHIVPLYHTEKNTLTHYVHSNNAY